MNELRAMLKLLWVCIQHFLGRSESEIKLSVSPAEADYLYRVAIRNGWRALAVQLNAARPDSENE